MGQYRCSMRWMRFVEFLGMQPSSVFSFGFLTSSIVLTRWEKWQTFYFVEKFLSETRSTGSFGRQLSSDKLQHFGCLFILVLYFAIDELEWGDKCIEICVNSMFFLTKKRKCKNKGKNKSKSLWARHSLITGSQILGLANMSNELPKNLHTWEMVLRRNAKQKIAKKNEEESGQKKGRLSLTCTEYFV